MKIYKNLLPVFALGVCVYILSAWTQGFRAFTVFSYTMEEAGPLPRTFPDLRLTDQSGNSFEIQDLRSYTLLNFVYLNCPFVCHKVNNQLEEIYQATAGRLPIGELRFLTVSFDLENDNIGKIEKYRSYFGDDIDDWTFALPRQTDETELRAILKNAGIWINKNPETGRIDHSVHIFLLSPDHQIIRVFDPARADPHSMTEEIVQCVKKDLLAWGQ